MGDYLEAVVDGCASSSERTIINLKIEREPKQIRFNIPFFLRLNNGDKLHFSNVKVEKLPNCYEIGDNYRDVEITRKNEKKYFLKLESRDMQLLENIKDNYGV